MTGLVKRKEQILLIHTERFSKINWKQWKKMEPYALVPKIEWSIRYVHLIFSLGEYLFVDRHFEKNERQYHLSHFEV